MNKLTCILTLSFIFTISNVAIGQRNTTTVKRPVVGTDSARTNNTVPVTPPKQDSPQRDNPPTPAPIPPGTAQQTPAPSTDTTNALLTSITKYVDKIVGFALPYALVASLVGALSMALLQTIKDIFPVRSWYQKWMLRKWYIDKHDKMMGMQRILKREDIINFLRYQGLAENQIDKYTKEFEDAGAAISIASFESFQDQLLSLSTDGNEDAFYDLAIEQMCGQMNACAQLAIEYPIRYSKVLSPLVASADPIDIDLLFIIQPSWLSSDNVEAKVFSPLYVEARNRVAHHIQRAVDAIQISFGAGWKKILQIASIIISGVICALGIGFLDTKLELFPRISIAIISAIVGGFLAPVARDLVAALQKLRS
jgi:hypothetical protein